MNRILRTSLRATGVLCVVLCVVLVTSGAPIFGEGNAEPRQPAANPNEALGARLFDEVIAWVGRGVNGIERANDFYVKLDAELDLDQTRHNGPMRVWWASNERFRWEITTNGRTTTKILNVRADQTPPFPQMWIIESDGRVRRMHGTREGATAIPQLQEDSGRLGDLAQFITLKELKGAGVQFLCRGMTKGNGTYAGDWVKVSRTVQGAATIHFWLAYTKDAEGTVHATWPGIVRVDGDARQKLPTEDYILKDWRDSPAGQPRGFRYPRTIEAYSSMPGSAQGPARFLKATVQDIKINAGIDASRFQPPSKRGGGGRR